MNHRSLLLLFLATALLCGLIRAQQPAFRSAIDVVSMNGTVTERRTNTLRIDRKDFEIFEDGVKQE